MDWKKFPIDLRKISLLPILLILSSVLIFHTPYSPFMRKEYHGFPAIVYTISVDNTTGNIAFSLEEGGLMIGIVFYYLISFLIIYVYDIVKR